MQDLGSNLNIVEYKFITKMEYVNDGCSSNLNIVEYKSDTVYGNFSRFW